MNFVWSVLSIGASSCGHEDKINLATEITEDTEGNKNENRIIKQI
jgi:hypothetical protein